MPGVAQGSTSPALAQEEKAGGDSSIMTTQQARARMTRTQCHEAASQKQASLSQAAREATACFSWLRACSRIASLHGVPAPLRGGVPKA